jgi:indole-3-glycerol phosphate synthase
MTEGKGTYLEAIVAAKRAELADSRKARAGAVANGALADELAELPPARDFEAALRSGPRPRLIAEFKRTSPSAGTIREDAQPGPIALSYVEAGAAAISVLADRHFEGSLDDVREVRRAVTVPVLCKDFVLERSQIVEARRAGADAILLIVAILEPPRLRAFVEFAHTIGMQVLCEAHTEHELDRALAAGARIVGVNARDLHTFTVEIQRCIDLRERVPASFVYVAESGIHTAADVDRLRRARVDAILVGTRLMAAPDPGQAVRELVGGGAG